MSKRFPKRKTQAASQQNRSELVDLLSNIEERLIELSSLRLDGGTQPREALDEETRSDYAARMVLGEDAQRRERVLDPEGQMWPPLAVFHDGENHWLADGFHRLSAARALGLERFQARIWQGTQRDAIRHSLGVNARHGKRRTNADKRRAVERALIDEEWSRFSDNMIAEMCKVSQPFVSKLRKALTSTGDIARAGDERLGRDGELHEVSRAPTRARSSSSSEDVSARAAKETSSDEDEGGMGSAAARERVELDFDTLADQALLPSVIVAHPEGEEDWRALGVAMRGQGATVVAMLPPRGALLWRGPAALSDAAKDTELVPTLCHLRAGEETALVWCVGGEEEALPRSVEHLEGLLERLGAGRIAQVSRRAPRH